MDESSLSESRSSKSDPNLLHPLERPPERNQVRYATGQLGTKGDLDSLKTPIISYEEVEKWVAKDRKPIGRGSYGDVYAGIIRGTRVAIKKLKDSGKEQYRSWESKLEALRSEIEIMSEVRHKNVVRFYGMVKDPNNPSTRLLVSELLSSKNVGHLLKEKVHIPMMRRLYMVRDMAEGMAWLHGGRVKIVHFDLKPQNLLLDKNWNVKVADFGLSKVLLENESMRTERGTPIYRSPELLKRTHCDWSTDVWSFALVAWEIVTGEEVFPWAKNQEQLTDRIVRQHVRPPCPELNIEGELISPLFYQLIKECLNDKPEKRPTFPEILHRIDQIVVNVAIVDPAARKLWTKIVKQEPNPDFSRLEFHLLPPALELAFSIPKEQTQLINELFTAPHTSPLSTTNRYLHITDFGYFCLWFGPFDKDIMKRAENIMRQKWFYGYLNKEDSADMLADSPDHTFLIRCSITQPETAPFSISKRKGGATLMQRILVTKDRSKFYVELDSSWTSKEKKTIYSKDNDLVAFIQLISGPLKLSFPLPGAPFCKDLDPNDEIVDLGFVG